MYHVAEFSVFSDFAYKVPKTAFLPKNSESRLNIQRSCPNIQAAAQELNFLPKNRRRLGSTQ